ncbi:MAG: histidinol-phosphate transaminase [Clostridia bacterium]|nr:histidinol-phosphate transaminase [Clostridia bacterium]
MSVFFSEKYKALTPYVPGEQPKERRFIKLNTNESPFPPSKKAQGYAAAAAQSLQLYSDPTCARLTAKVAEVLGVAPDEVLLTNGSDEILNFAFMAFCDEKTPAAFADITYGFYKVFAALNGVPYTEIPLKEDFSIDPADYYGLGKTIFIANPNAPTGIALSRDAIEEIVKQNPNTVVVIDEAYVDFGAESCVPLIRKYKNLLVTQTFSKSRSMAGARLGFGVACPELIADLNTIKYSTNPYNVNSLTLAAGLGTMEDEEYTRNNCQTVQENREYLAGELAAMGFVQTSSKANFIFAKHPRVAGERIYAALREKGILVRHFTAPRIAQYNRITIGARADMEALVRALQEILEEEK